MDIKSLAATITTRRLTEDGPSNYNALKAVGSFVEPTPEERKRREDEGRMYMTQQTEIELQQLIARYVFAALIADPECAHPDTLIDTAMHAITALLERGITPNLQRVAWRD